MVPDITLTEWLLIGIFVWAFLIAHRVESLPGLLRKAEQTKEVELKILTRLSNDLQEAVDNLKEINSNSDRKHSNLSKHWDDSVKMG